MKFCPKGAAAAKSHRKRRGADRELGAHSSPGVLKLAFVCVLKQIYRECSRVASCFGDRPVHARCVRIVSGAASRCDMHTLKTDRAARGIFGASRKQRRSCGHAKFERAICRTPRLDRAWFRALAVSCVEFMRGLGEIVQRALRNLKRAAVVEPRCRGGHKTKTP